MIQNPLFSNSLLHRREKSDLFPMVALADTRQLGDAVANEVFAIGGSKIWSLLVDAIEAANEGIVRERNAGGVVGERIVLERT